MKQQSSPTWNRALENTTPLAKLKRRRNCDPAAKLSGRRGTAARTWEFAATARGPWLRAQRELVERSGDPLRMRAESLPCQGDVENLGD
ncbi:hypothetical protein NDU88_004547 [Pleurodeles waltl]|uniref:Uncharacterized protein n=1 Tax=Pleurodeles waltl TaxID=8319 RepID=A0AAV7TRT2_PLEWA|nr:hypothetical protein NDU88_004547 [Pleurodeles waltl]